MIYLLASNGNMNESETVGRSKPERTSTQVLERVKPFNVNFMLNASVPGIDLEGLAHLRM